VKQIAFSATIGVVEGYAHDNGLPAGTTADAIVATAWISAMKAEFDTSKIGVGGVITASRTAYNPDWGCPAGGELTATVSGESNPEFDKDTEAYKAAVLRIVKAVKTALKQSTVRVAFHEVDDYVYLTKEDEAAAAS
jgi:hypothetical protein